MGRRSWSSRDTVEGCSSISTFWLKQQGYFKHVSSNQKSTTYVVGGIKWKNSIDEDRGSVGFSIRIYEDIGQITFQYVYTDQASGEKENLSYPINLTSTPCRYGGRRWWFKCTASKNGLYCGRRVATLHLAPGGKYFACRHCYNLTYQVCKGHSKHLDALRKNPAMLMSYFNSKDLTKNLLAIKAGIFK